MSHRPAHCGLTIFLPDDVIGRLDSRRLEFFKNSADTNLATAYLQLL
uniref:Uncharacterized protein n=1 Tax=Lymantria dispar multicapsid nuclear polyhedrosis virus TaxID=10449 RepID=A0A4Y5X3N4_NPVLD|nr:hypothetical protein LdMNPV-J2_00030 [Lymantria dispar multiple nucleopolyhedrovirus]